MRANDLYEALAIPYVVVMYSTEIDGNWMRHAEYPELPECSVDAFDTLACLEKLDALRIRTIVGILKTGGEPPRPRPPLKSGLALVGSLDLDKLLESILQGSLERLQ